MRSDTSESDSAGFSPEEVNDLRTEASAEALGSSSMPSQEDAAPGPLLRAVTLLLDEHEISIASMAAGGSEFENRRDPAGDTSEAHSESESSLFEEDELGEVTSRHMPTLGLLLHAAGKKMPVKSKEGFSMVSWNEWRKAQARAVAEAKGDALISALQAETADARASALAEVQQISEAAFTSAVVLT